MGNSTITESLQIFFLCLLTVVLSVQAGFGEPLLLEKTDDQTNGRNATDGNGSPDVFAVTVYFDRSFLKVWKSDDGIIYTGRDGGNYFFSNTKMIRIKRGTASVKKTEKHTVSELSFWAYPLSEKEIHIAWTTKAGTAITGYNLCRADTRDGPYHRTNDFFIPGQHAPAGSGTYAFVDKNVKKGNIYYYTLEEIDSVGSAIHHGPVSAIPRMVMGKIK